MVRTTATNRSDNDKRNISRGFSILMSAKMAGEQSGYSMGIRDTNTGRITV